MCAPMTASRGARGEPPFLLHPRSLPVLPGPEGVLGCLSTPGGCPGSGACQQARQGGPMRSLPPSPPRRFPPSLRPFRGCSARSPRCLHVMNLNSPRRGLPSPGERRGPGTAKGSSHPRGLTPVQGSAGAKALSVYKWRRSHSPLSTSWRVFDL